MQLPFFQGLIVALSLSALALLPACTATEQTGERAAPSVAVPTQVVTDADRRAIYNSNGGYTNNAQPVPDATPNRLRLGEQASGINSRKRVETVNTNDANNTTPETRLWRLDYDTPAPLPDTSSFRR